MLIGFQVRNFRSLRDEVVISLHVPSWQDIGSHVAFEMPGAGEDRIGVVAGLYGANASGKSNVLDALAFMRAAVANSHQVWLPGSGTRHQPFRSTRHLDQAATFEVELLLDAERFIYGFTIDRQKVREEWLYSYPKGRRRLWFERNVDSEPVFRFGRVLTGRMGTLAGFARENGLFLSVAAANNHPRLSDIARWFSEGVRISRPHASRGVWLPGLLRHLETESGLDQVRRMLSFADLGITNLTAVADPVDESVREQVTKLLQVIYPDDAEVAKRAFRDMSRSLELTHLLDEDGEEVRLPLNLESHGTQSWLALLEPILTALQNGQLLLVDELDASLHPHLSSEIIRIFHDSELNRHGAQLIFNTHDPTLMGHLLDDSPLRRDEVWMTEKDRYGVTRLYPLTDFRPRRAENLERGYLQGRYGAVPHVRSDRLFAVTGGTV